MSTSRKQKLRKRAEKAKRRGVRLAEHRPAARPSHTCAAAVAAICAKFEEVGPLPRNSDLGRSLLALANRGEICVLKAEHMLKPPVCISCTAPMVICECGCGNPACLDWDQLWWECLLCSKTYPLGHISEN